MGKVLVLYYSFEGNTKRVAERMASEISCDVVGIKPINEIKTHGFMKFFWGGKQAVMKSKPEIEPLKVDIKDYDVILIGTPVWAGTFAPPLRTLLYTKDLYGKKVGYFYTHEGGAKKFRKRMEEELLSMNCDIIDYLELENVDKKFVLLEPLINAFAKEAKKEAENISCNVKDR